MHSVVLQDGTNSFLKFDRKPADIFESLKKLVNICLEKFNPDQFVICEVIPMTYLSQNATKNSRIDEFNSMIHNHYGENSNNIKILKLKQMIKIVENYDSLYHGIVTLTFGQVYSFSKTNYQRKFYRSQTDSLLVNGKILKELLRKETKPARVINSKTISMQHKYMELHRITNNIATISTWTGGTINRDQNHTTKLSTKETLKTILITADIALTDTLHTIFCVSSRLRLSAKRKAKTFCFLILLNTNEKNILAAGSSAIACHHSSRVSSSKNPGSLYDTWQLSKR